jgi:hypothetical protein
MTTLPGDEKVHLIREERAKIAGVDRARIEGTR